MIHVTRMAAVLLIFASTAYSQSIDITIADKNGTPRKSLPLVYEVSGVNVDSLDNLPIRMYQGTARTDSNGEFKLSVATISAALDRHRSALTDSKQIRVFIHPQSPDEELASIPIDFLLGTEAQQITVVVMQAAFAAGVEDAGKAVYRGRNTTIHLLGQRGTVVYCTANRKYDLAEIEFLAEDACFMYFLQSGSDSQWAVRKNCSKSIVWRRESSSSLWKKHEIARRQIIP